MMRIVGYSPQKMRRIPYIWERPDWPQFRWNSGALLAAVEAERYKQGVLLGKMERFGYDLRQEAQLEATTEDVVKSSEIEGEHLDRASVRSSVARRLGMPGVAQIPTDARTEGVVEMTLDATQNYGQPLTAERLFGWHAALFPTGFSGMHRIRIGAWRDDAHGPMQVVSGPIGRQKMHFEAPPAARLTSEMQRFLHWFNEESDQKSVVTAGLAHLWFVAIHPFDDGNGRIARAIADQALARSEGSSQRFYSMSHQIRAERKRYYDVLESTQKGDLDVTDWLLWFVGCLERAIDGAEQIMGTVVKKAEFWQRFSAEPLSERQKKVLNRYLEGFEGNLTAKKWAGIGHCSAATAQRDINDLLDRGILKRNSGGSKNTSYILVD
jgi:Fic family protein